MKLSIVVNGPVAISMEIGSRGLATGCGKHSPCSRDTVNTYPQSSCIAMMYFINSVITDNVKWHLQFGNLVNINMGIYLFNLNASILVEAM